MNLQTKNPLPSTLVLFSYHSYHFVMWLWFFTGAQKVQLSQGANGKTLCSLVLIISFLPRTRLPALARRDPFLLHWHQQPECHSFVTVWSLGAEFSAPNADWGWVFCWFFFALRFITKPVKMEGLLTESVPHILVLWRWIILLISKEWQMCMKFNISVTDCRLVAWMLIPGFGSSSKTLCSLCW